MEFLNQGMGMGRTPFAIGAPRIVSTSVPEYRTTFGERLLLLITVFAMPLESHIPTVAGLSSQFLIFSILAGYLILNRARALDMVWMHPVFIAAYVFIAVSIALEFASPSPSYEVISRFAMMIAGAVLIASLCRDRAALRFFLYGYICAAVWLGGLLFLHSYGALSGLEATDFQDASLVRVQAFKDNPIKGNLNAMAFNCVQGGIVAVAFALGNASSRGKSIFVAIASFCLVASSLPMSRGGMLNALLSCMAVLKSYGIKHMATWILAAILATSAFLLVPDAIWSRMAVKTAEGEQDTRAYFYSLALRHVEEYAFMGLGAGNYLGKWGFENGFAKLHNSIYIVYVVHNIFLQVMMYWGSIGLLAFCVLIFQAYNCLPYQCGKDVLAQGVLGIAVSLLLLMPFISEFYSKGFSLGLGMLVASSCWIWPSGSTRSVET